MYDHDHSLYYRQLKEKDPDKTIVAFTGGNFDYIHYGYVVTFEEAKRHCDKFIVFLQKDPSSTRYTKYKPIVPYYERYKTLMSIKHIDEVYMYQTESELYDLIKLFKPDIRILGEDYLGKSFTGDDLPPKVIYTTRSHEWSTTKIKNRIAAMTYAQNPDMFKGINIDQIKNNNFSSIEQ
jgi:glycerol-3-phosphate cytidylyltransferase